MTTKRIGDLHVGGTVLTEAGGEAVIKVSGMATNDPHIGFWALAWTYVDGPWHGRPMSGFFNPDSKVNVR